MNYNYCCIHKQRTHEKTFVFSHALWTPTVAATGFEYPATIQDRYIGDAIELGYTIQSTGADDSIVHIVQ